MSFIDRIKAKPKQNPNSDNKVDKRVIQSIITTDQLSKEYLDRTDMNSLVKAYKHVVYVCVNKNSTVMSTIGFKLISKKKPSSRSVKYKELSKYEKMKLNERKIKKLNNSNDLVEITEHPFLDMMARPNPLTTYSDFIYQTNTYKDLTGNTFWYVEKNGTGMPVGLYIMPTQDMKIKPSGKFFIEKYMMKNGDSYIDFKLDEVIHHKTFDPANQFFGMSPLAACESVYNMREYMDRYELHLYANDGRPSAIIHTDQSVIGSEGWEDMRALLRREIGGLNNTGKVGLLDKGFEYQQISVNPRDLESLAGRKATASEIRNAYGQTDALYDASANRATSDTADYSFRRDAILPRLTFIQDRINSELLPMFDENLVFVFDNPVPVDVEKQSEQLTKYVTNAILTPNEARHEIGYVAHEGELANELLVPVNIATMAQVAENKKEEDNKKQNDAKEEEEDD